ncbi:hypothetical protein SLS62_010699 [Diatrype stigma]|uniref:Methyltransferase domain-containing protein n=1 Tax=Diatrype stigma TaxID=117547 RepID=A0AAN9UAG0_9PEZI
MRLLDILMREDLDSMPEPRPPESMVQYIRDIRRLSLAREFSPQQKKLPKMTRLVSVGMTPKKIHEVSNFASYVDQLASDIADDIGGDVTHFVDFGSGQNYLGRALASAPYNKQIVAVEGREHNIAGARELDVRARLTEKPIVMRNKKLYMQQLASTTPGDQLNKKVLRQMANPAKINDDYVADFRPLRELQTIYKPDDGKGFIRYIDGRLESGDLTDVVTQLEDAVTLESQESKDLRLMAISIHSCGNLSHHGIRSLILNPRVQAIAIVGCCYNLLTERLGPPTYKLPYMRPSLQAMNGRVVRESSRYDPQGFPMSDRLCNYKDMGIRQNITARMMACQAPQNWTEAESDGFFTRHFYRAVLQKIFLDRGVITKVFHYNDDDNSNGEEGEANLSSTADSSRSSSPFNSSTKPVIIGSLRKSCYGSFTAYVRGAIAKLTTHSDHREHCGPIIQEKMGGITDAEISQYEQAYLPRRRELSSVWSLMAFSAVVVEALIVTDRWLFLRQHQDVQKCWVEAVFDYHQSPRNLVVVGVKKNIQPQP